MDDLVLAFERLAQLAAETGARVALETLERDKEQRRDRRLRNTKFLLKKYRMLKLHQLESGVCQVKCACAYLTLNGI